MRVVTDAEREKRMRNLVVLVVDPVRRYPHRRAADVIGDTLLGVLAQPRRAARRRTPLGDRRRSAMPQ